MTHPFLNNGVGIPKQMHISSLAMKPNKSIIEQTKEDQFIDQPMEQMRIEQNDPVDNIDPNQEIYVKKWVDYSTKYGVGYLLSNGNTGVFFNDYSKIIYNPTYKYFEYMERKDQKQDIMKCYYISSYP